MFKGEERMSDLDWILECKGRACWAHDSGGMKEVDAARAELAALRNMVEKAKELVSQLEVVHKDAQYVSVWMLSQGRRGIYTGPTYGEELCKLKSALGAITGENK